METIEVKKSDIVQMQQTIRHLELQLYTIQNIFINYINSDNEDLRIIIKQLLTNNLPEKFIPEISEGDSTVSPVLLAGKWKDFDIDVKRLRREAWKEY